MAKNRFFSVLTAIAVCLLMATAAHAAVDFAADCDGYTLHVVAKNQLPPGASVAGKVVIELTDENGDVITCSDDIVLTADSNGVVDLTQTSPWCQSLDGSYILSAAITNQGGSFPIPTSSDPLECSCDGEIGDFVWNDGVVDEDCDGVQPSDMSLGINGVNVCLLDGNGDTVACTTTQEVVIGGDLVGGYYGFSGLCAGDYTVVVETPDGFVAAPSMNGGSASDSNGSPASVSLPADDSVDLTIDFGYCIEDGDDGGQGCTPGYWKNHEEDWVGYETTDRLGDVFSEVNGYGGFGDLTLMEAMQSGPEPDSILLQSVRNLMRHAVAALLNSSSGEVDFGVSPAGLIAEVNAALATADASTIQAKKDDLDRRNNSGCPL